MRDWKTLARASDLGIPAPEVDRVAAPLESLEETFRPLVRDLTPDLEPCTELRTDEGVE
jgi:hypothetical protein